MIAVRNQRAAARAKTEFRVTTIKMKKYATLILTTLLLAACTAPDRPSISLYLALQRGDIDQIERHIHWGTDLNELDPDGRRPLHVAAENGRTIVVKMLLKHGVEVNAPDQSNSSAIERAILAGRTQIGDLLLENGAELDASSLLLRAARNDSADRDVVRWLIAHGAESEHRGTDGDTPLLVSVRHGNHRMVRHLVDNGADVNVKDAQGNSALAIARALNFPEIARGLRRYGAADP